MRVTLATEPGTPGWPNEDFAAAAPGAAVLLDGASQFPRDADSGCVHGVAWHARTLGTGLLAEITAEPAIPLSQALARAIAAVRARHQGTCDLDHPATPAATVTALRLAPGRIDYLAISDSTIAADPGDGEPLIITDTRPPARTDLATSDPAAATRACTGSIPLAGLRGISLLSDGAARITDRFGLLTWTGVLALIRDAGPGELIRQVRAVEATDPDGIRWPRSKPADDATILYWHLSD
jgi:Protein phosphatase 2C